MKRIKSAPANIAEMVNRKKKPDILPVKKEQPTILAILTSNGNNGNDNNDFPHKKYKKIDNDKIDNDKIDNDKIDNDKKIKNVKILNSNTERMTNILNDVLNDIFSLSFEETAFLGIILNLLNNTFRKDKLRDLTGIVIQHSVKYLLMFYIHHYVLNDYIEKHSHINFIDYIH